MELRPIIPALLRSTPRPVIWATRMAARVFAKCKMGICPVIIAGPAHLNNWFSPSSNQLQRTRSFFAIMTAMSRIRSVSELLLVARAGLWLCAARTGLWIVSFQRLHGAVAFLTRKPPKGGGINSLPRLVWAVSAASRYVPQATCLTKALALHILLKRAGLESSIHFGVAKEGVRFEAHAWVKSQDKIVIGDFESTRYVPIMVWE